VVFGDYFPGGSRTGSRGPTRKSRHSRFARNTPEVTTGGDGDSSPRKEKRRAEQRQTWKLNGDSKAPSYYLRAGTVGIASNN
jgi:hypothetical protein